MEPADSANGDLKGCQWPRGHVDGGSAIVLQASKIAIHVRPRSPGRSPAKYLHVDSIGAGHSDVSAPRDADSRHLLHLEVEQQPRAGSHQPGAGPKPAPRAVLDVVQIQPQRGTAHSHSTTAGAPPAAPAAASHAAAAGFSFAVPPAARDRPGTRPATAATTTLAASRPGAQPIALPGRHPDNVVTAASAAAAAPVGSAHALHSRGAGAAAASASNIFAAAAAPAAVAAAVAAASVSAAGAPLALAGTSYNMAAAPVAAQRAEPASRSAKGGGAALLAELMGTQMAPPQSGPAVGRLPDYTAAGPGLPFPGEASFSFRPVPAAAAPGGGGGAFLRESAGLAWSWEGLPGVSVGLGGMPDPDEEARRARRRHRKRVARIVVDHWKAFAAEGLRAVVARRHLRRRLLTAAWVAWQTETASARSRLRLAAVYDMKRSYLGLGRCVQAWSAAAKRLARLRSLEERVALSRLLRQSRACLRAWRRRCYDAAEKRRRQLQAWFYYSFSTLTRALRKWRAWADGRRAKARRVAWASERHAAALGRKALAAWRRRLAHRRWKAAATEAAAGLRRRGALRAALRGWRDGAAARRVAREAAAAALRAAAAGMEAQVAAAAFVEWKAYAAERRRRRQRERYGLAYMRRWWQLVAMWAWRQHVARVRHLRMCEREMQRVGRHVRLGMWWSRWCLVVEVLQGQRNGQLRAAVLGRACWATWRAVVEHGAAKRELLRIATQRVGRVVAAAALAAWRTRADQWRAKAAAWSRASSWHRRRSLARLLPGWRREAERLMGKAAAERAAAQHRRRRVLGRALRLWRRYACALRGWLLRARYKAAKELDRRRAVRHRYLTLLHSGLLAFRAAVDRRLAKQRDWADLARLHGRHVSRAVLRAWRHGFVPVAAAKRAVALRADLRRRATLLRSAMATWVRETARLAAKHGRQREAAGFASLQLMRRALLRWAVAPALQDAHRAVKRERLAALRAALAAAAVRRLLAAWREVHQDRIVKRFLDSRARVAWRDRTLRRALTAWALYLAHRRAAGLLTARAHGARRIRVFRAVLAALAAHAAARRAKRRLAAAVSEHRRVGLLRRTLAVLAWYGGYRAAKARGYAAARTQYVRRLQREGAAAWLRVGTERRQQRIEMLAAQQAHELVRQLALVEPFARRWLQTVRSRRRRHGYPWLPFTLAVDRLSDPTAASASALHWAAGGHHPRPHEHTWRDAAGGAGGRRAAAAVQRTAAVPAATAAARESWQRWDADADAGFPAYGSHGPSQLARQLRNSQAPGFEPAQPAAAWQSAAAGGGPAALSAATGWAPGSGLPGATAAAAAGGPRRPPPRTPLSAQGLGTTGMAGPWAEGPRLAASPGATGMTTSPRAAGAAAAAATAADAGAVYYGAGGLPQATSALPESRQRVPLRGVNAAALPQPAASGLGFGGGGGVKGAVPRRARPQPRCPDFLMSQRRPATVDESPEPRTDMLPRTANVDVAAAVSAAIGSRGGEGRGAVRGGGGSSALCQVAMAGRQPAPTPAPLFFANLAHVRTHIGAMPGGGGGGGGGGLSQAGGPAGFVGGVSGELDDRAAAAAAVVCLSPSPTAGITIHRPGPRPPDVLRLPTRGGECAAGDDDDGSSARSASGGRGGPAAQPAAAGLSIAGSMVPLRAAGQGPQSTVSQQQQQPQQPPSHAGPQAATLSSSSSSSAAAAAASGGELGELESVLLHCKRLKQLLQQLETEEEDAAAEEEEQEEAGDPAAEGTDEGATGGTNAVGQGRRRRRRQQAAEVRAALVALRPTVEQAAARLRQIRGLGSAG
ncbi:hypothetical protein PLESTM_001937200 [Pleodorina starrii]|nr:hypothetical protein PLESTM_001937200 [Pleodorina starrii]